MGIHDTVNTIIHVMGTRRTNLSEMGPSMHLGYQRSVVEHEDIFLFYGLVYQKPDSKTYMYTADTLGNHLGEAAPSIHTDHIRRTSVLYTVHSIFALSLHDGQFNVSIVMATHNCNYGLLCASFCQRYYGCLHTFHSYYYAVLRMCIVLLHIISNMESLFPNSLSHLCASNKLA